MATKIITLKLAGQDENNYILLGDYIEELEAVKSILHKIDLQLSDNKESVKYRVIGLSLRSPSTTKIEAVPIREEEDRSAEIVEGFYYGLESIVVKKQYPLKLDAPIVTAFQDLGKKLGSGISAITISGNGYKYDLPKDYKEIVEEIIGIDQYETGEITGEILRINLHRSPRQFYIYPAVGPTSVACNIRSDLLDDALKAVGKRAIVQGKMRFKKHSYFPHEIDVEKIEITPPIGEFPKLCDLRGMAPNASGNLSPEEYQRKIRNAW
jgi:hypothetical protein